MDAVTTRASSKMRVRETRMSVFPRYNEEEMGRAWGVWLNGDGVLEHKKRRKMLVGILAIARNTGVRVLGLEAKKYENITINPPM